MRDMVRRREYMRQWKKRNAERVRTMHREYMRTWTPPAKRGAPADAAKRKQLQAEIAKRKQLQAEIANITWLAVHCATVEPGASHA